MSVWVHSGGLYERHSGAAAGKGEFHSVGSSPACSLLVNLPDLMIFGESKLTMQQ